MLNKNDIVEVEIVDLTHEGARCCQGGRLWLFPWIMPFQVKSSRCACLSSRKISALGKGLRLCDLSPNRNQDIDATYLRSGIADFGHMTYEELKFKRKQVVDNPL